MRAATVLLLAAALALPMTASAQRGPGPGMRGPGPGGPGGPPPERREEAERRLRTLRAVSLANYLELEEAKALEMNAVMARYDEKRDAVREELRGHMQVLREAADAEQVDAKAVDAAIEGVISARARLEQLSHDEARELMKGLDAKRKARLMLFFKEFPKRVRRMMRGMDPDAPRGRRGRRGGGAGPNPR